MIRRADRRAFDLSAPLVIARLWEAAGEPGAALETLRRRGRVGVRPAATYHREEGRLALLVGDTAGAIRAWSRYLAVRTATDPDVMPEVERVRVALARLGRDAHR